VHCYRILGSALDAENRYLASRVSVAARIRVASGTAEADAAGEALGKRWPGRVLIRQRSRCRTGSQGGWPGG